MSIDGYREPLEGYAALKEDVAGRLTQNDLRILGEDAENMVSRRLPCLGILAAEAPIDRKDFDAACAYDLPQEQADRLLEMAIEMGLLRHEAAEVKYWVPDPVFLPDDLSGLLSEDDARMFGEEANAVIIGRLGRIEKLASRSEKHDSSAIRIAFGDDLSEEQTARLLEIAQTQGVGLMFERTKEACYKIPSSAHQMLQECLNGVDEGVS